MREIKFRAWDKKGNRMCPNDHIHTVGVIEGKVAIGSGISGDYVTLDEGFEIMQYTGLKDKNGVEIYEGDILAVKFFGLWVERVGWNGPPDAIAEVYWDFAGFGLKARGQQDFRYPGLHDVNKLESEVIGNIYATPELLEKE